MKNKKEKKKMHEIIKNRMNGPKFLEKIKQSSSKKNKE